MKCAKCQFDSPQGMKFCVECGNKLEAICPKCGFSNSPSFKFCGDCGHNLSVPSEGIPKDLTFDEKLEKIQRYLPKGLTEKILSQRDRIEGERKQVTVMFCDMEGFTPLSEQIGTEEAYSIIDKIYEILIHKVHDHGGTVNEMTGDGILALFGAPIALEDGPQRAIRSAIAIHREIVKLSGQITNQRQIRPIKMRIGIHTGPVIVGTVGNDLRVEFKAVGDTVNLASRIEQIAEPGTTYVTKDTFKATEGLFRFENLGDHDIKGKKEPIGVYQVLAPSTRRTRFDVSSEQGLTPFVGRERELELLLDGFERVKSGRGQAFSIIAEAGLGKSRLLYEFRKAIANEDVTFLEGKCLSYSRDVAYYPIIDILKTNFNIQVNDEDQQIIDKVKKRLKNLVVDESTTLPCLLELLSVNDSGIDDIAMSPEEKRVRTVESLKQIVLKGSELRPLIIAVEDLHWIDKNSEESVKFLLESIAGSNVMLVFTYRTEFVHTWGGRSYHNQVTLNRLSNRESLLMISHLLKTQKIEKNLEDFILEKTEGIPFFVEEFIKSLKDLKGIERKENMLCLVGNQNEMTVPTRIQDVIMARVDSLPESAKQILQIGSVIGREFSHKLLMKITNISEQELISRLSLLKDSELLYERGIYPQSTYIFKHALTQESVYLSLLKSTRQKYHRMVAEAVENHFPDIAEAEPQILANHFTEADLAEKSIPYWKKSGEKAARQSADIEAIKQIKKGLNALKSLPTNDDRMKQELSLLISLGPSLSAVEGSGSPEVESLYLRARELCQKIGHLPEHFFVFEALARFFGRRGNYDISNELSEKLLTIAEREEKPEYLIVAYRQIGSNHFYIGNLSKAKIYLERSLDIYHSNKDPRLVFNYTIHPIIHCLSFLSWTNWLLGFSEKAFRLHEKALALAHKIDHTFSLAVALTMGAWLNSYSRDIVMTQKCTEMAISLSKDRQFNIQIVIGNFLKNWALSMQNKNEKTLTRMRDGIEALRAIGSEQPGAILLVRLSEGYIKCDKLDLAINSIKKAGDLLNKSNERFWESEVLRLKGELALLQTGENKSEAESYFQNALNFSRRQKAKSLELRASISLSRLWQSQGKREKARDLLSEIYGWFTEGFDTADLKEAKALLDDLS